MKGVGAVAKLIESLRLIASVEPSHLHKISSEALKARSAAPFQEVALFVLAAVYSNLAFAIERRGADDGAANNLADTISMSLRILSHSQWEDGKADLVALIEVNRPGNLFH